MTGSTTTGPSGATGSTPCTPRWPEGRRNGREHHRNHASTRRDTRSDPGRGRLRDRDRRPLGRVHPAGTAGALGGSGLGRPPGRRHDRGRLHQHLDRLRPGRGVRRTAPPVADDAARHRGRGPDRGLAQRRRLEDAPGRRGARSAPRRDRRPRRRVAGAPGRPRPLAGARRRRPIPTAGPRHATQPDGTSAGRSWPRRTATSPSRGADPDARTRRLPRDDPGRGAGGDPGARARAGPSPRAESQSRVAVQARVVVADAASYGRDSAPQKAASSRSISDRSVASAMASSAVSLGRLWCAKNCAAATLPS